MTSRSAHLVAAAAAVALLAGVPFGLAVAFALVDSSGPPLSTVVRQFPALLELTAGCVWAGGVFLPVAWLSNRSKAVGSALVAAGPFAVAFATGALGFYRSDSLPYRVLFSAQYALLVLLAFLLFGFLASWLEAKPATRP